MPFEEYQTLVDELLLSGMTLTEAYDELHRQGCEGPRNGAAMDPRW